MTARTLIDALGGFRPVALRLSKAPTTVHTHMQTGTLPASWYVALCQMVEEINAEIVDPAEHIAPPDRALFSFLQLEEDAA